MKRLKITKNFHTYRYHLYHLILKSLRLLFFEKKDVPYYTDTKLMGYLLDIQILMQKGLDDQARELLNKGKQQALKENKHQFLLILLKKELDFVLRNDVQKMSTQVDLIFEEKQQCLRLIEVENHLWKYYYEIAVFIRKRGAVRPEQKIDLVHRIKSDPLLQDFETATTFAMKYLFYYINAYQYYFIKEYQEYHTYLAQTIAIWGEHNYKKKEEPRNYKVFLANYINSCFLIKSHEDVLNLVSKLEKIETSSFAEEAETFSNVGFFKLLYYLNTTNFKQPVVELTEIMVTIDYIEQGLEKYKTHLPKSRELTFYYNISILFLLIRDFFKALDWLTKILKEPRNEHRKDLVRTAHLLQLIYYFVLDDIETVEARCESVRRNFNRWDRVEAHEHIIISGIKKLLDPISKKTEQQAFKDFYTQLQNFKTAHSETPVLGLEETLLWLEYKVK